MAKLDPDRSLLDASLELFSLISHAESLLVFFEQRSLQKEYPDKFEMIKDRIRQSAPAVVDAIEKSKYRFAEISNVVHIETTPIPPFEPIPFYPPPDGLITQYASDPGPILGTSSHHAGSYFLSAFCLRTDLWTYSDDDLFVTAPPSFDANPLLVGIEWERYKLFGEKAADSEAPGARRFSTHDLSVIFKTGQRTIENRLREIKHTTKGDHPVSVVRDLATYLSRKKRIGKDTSDAAKEIAKLEGVDLVRFLNFHFE